MTASIPPVTGLSGQVQKKMDVFASCGARIGKVDHLDGDQIKLMKNDNVSGGQHHWIPASWVANVDGESVHLSKNSDEVKRQWTAETEV